MRILVISLAGIGDTLMATPIIHELREQFPDGEIEALVLWPGSESILWRNPHLDGIHRHHFIRQSRWSSLRFVMGLRRRGYDVSLNLHPQGRREYRWIARLIGARERLSHEYENARPLDRRLVTRSIPQDYTIHCIDNNLRLLGLIGLEPKLPRHDYELYFSEAEYERTAEFVRRNNLTGRTLLGVHVGTGSTKNLALRRWPTENYIELFRTLLAGEENLSILLFGGPDEAEVHAEILRAVKDRRLITPATGSLREAATLLAHCRTFLSVDTVFMHLAAAMKVPKQIVIQSPTFNPPVYPRRPDWMVVTNPAIGDRALDWYRYDGRPVAGSADEIRRLMSAVTVDSVLTAVQGAFSGVSP